MEREVIPIFPLNTVLFPGMLLPLNIFEDRYKLMLKHCLAESVDFGVVLLKDGQPEGPLSGDVFRIGTTAQIRQVDSIGDRFNILSVGIRRFRVIELHAELYPYLSATVEYYPVESDFSANIRILGLELRRLMQIYLETYKRLKGKALQISEMPDDPLTLAFLIAIIMPVDNDIKQQILSMPDTYGMLKKEYELLRHENLVLELIEQSKPAWIQEKIQFNLN